MYYSKEQIDRANAVNLEEFLPSQGESLKKCGKDMEWKAHDSVKIRGNMWYRFSNNRGGYPIDFVMEFYGKTFPEAMEMLIGEKGEGQQEAVPAPSPDFRLPQRNITNVNVKNYLVTERGIDESIVDFFLNAGDIYEEKTHHNAVFVGRDEDHMPRYAHCRGINDKYRIDVTGSDKSYGFGYRGNNDQLCVFEAPIDLLSFINLFPKDWQDKNYIALGGVGYKALGRFLEEHKEIRLIFLCLDSDIAGETGCEQINKMIPEGIEVFRMRPPMKDWNELLLHKKELDPSQWFTMIDMRNQEDSRQFVPMIRMSDVAQTEVAFLWKPYIPFGKLTILQGDAGNGKTYLAMQLCAACTNRVPIPNMEILEPFNVIYQTAEDGLADTIKPRLIEAGADLDRVLVINESDGDPLTLTDDRIEKAIRQNNAGLLIIDPIQAYLGEKVDMNRANEVRPILRKIGDVAQRTGCAIVLIGHLNKATGQQSNYRGLGSVDFTAGVRSVLVIGKSKDDPNLRIMVHDKSSLAPPGTSIAFILGDEDGFRWIGDYDITADELLSGIEKKKEPKLHEAIQLVCELLADGKEILCEEIDRVAHEKGISSRTVRDAKKELGEAIKSRIITVDGKRKKLHWME
ncbi:MAG: AAA family ATPase [Erysipelotrichaceae bacterium]|nr:AAA family ATPase [Erysipelotrichaceae bacterium]